MWIGQLSAESKGIREMNSSSVAGTSPVSLAIRRYSVRLPSTWEIPDSPST